MKCARAEKLSGPWEVTTISEKESLGIGQGHSLRGLGRQSGPLEILPPDLNPALGLTLHQGGIIDTPTGQWWGYSMQDHNSIGRLTCLSPVTWVDGWPYFGLPGNLTRSPETWAKPNTGASSPALRPYDRSDDFSGKLKPVWQWNHVPDDSKWSLTERPGYLRLHSLPAKEFWWARNTLTQRAIGPESTVTTELDASGMKAGDVAGLALLNRPYAWIGVESGEDGLSIARFDQISSKTERLAITPKRLWLRAECNFDTEKALLSYSVDGKRFTQLGGEFTMVFQLKTFQGVRYSLFHYNTGGSPGGYIDFNDFDVHEPRPRGLMQAIPLGKSITIGTLSVKDGVVVAGETATLFKVIDRGRGRVAMESASGFLSAGDKGEVTVKAMPKPGDAETFQWIEFRNQVCLLSLTTNRYLAVHGVTVTANHTGPTPDRKDGSYFEWKIATKERL
jgi:hypothetical protein